MKNLQSSLGCLLLVSIFLQVFVEAKFVALYDTNVETQNLVKSGNADDKIARLEPFAKLIKTQDDDEKDVTDDNDEYDYDFDGAFVEFLEEVYNSYARLENDNEDDQRHARLIPNDEPQRFSKLLTDDDEVDFNDVGDSDKMNDNDNEDNNATDEVDYELIETSEDDDISDVDSKLVKKLKRHHQKNKATKGKGKNCGRKCRGKGRGRKPNWRRVVKKLKEAVKDKRNKNKQHRHGHKDAVKRCSRSSKVCCDGTVPNFDGNKSTPVCLDGGKPKCSLKDCKYTLLETFASWF